MSKKVNESISYDKRNHRKIIYKKYRDNNGRKITTIKSRRTASFSLVGCAFVGVLTLLLGTFFFNGYFNTAITSTQVNEIITNDINDTSYNVEYIDYDFTKKLSQLEGLRNVFSLEDFNTINGQVSNLRVPNPSFFMEGGKYHDDAYIIGQMIDNGIVHLQQSRFEYNEQGYSYYYLYADVVTIPNEYYPTYNNYVNSTNVLSWVDYQKRLIDNDEINIDNGVIVSDSGNWYDGLVQVIKIINAPIYWVGNFLYDLGVLVAFICVW